MLRKMIREILIESLSDDQLHEGIHNKNSLINEGIISKLADKISKALVGLGLMKSDKEELTQIKEKLTKAKEKLNPKGLEKAISVKDKPISVEKKVITDLGKGLRDCVDGLKKALKLLDIEDGVLESGPVADKIETYSYGNLARFDDIENYIKGDGKLSTMGKFNIKAFIKLRNQLNEISDVVQKEIDKKLKSS